MNNGTEIAFFFDLDGTLLDAIPFFNKLVIESIEEIGIEIDEELKKNLLIKAITAVPDKSNRKFIYELFFKIAEIVGITKKSDIYDLQVKAGLKYLEGMKHVNLIKGSSETLRFLDSKGFKLGIVTTSSEKDLAQKLGDLMEIIDVVYAREHTKKMKPHPDPILSAARDLDLEPCQCVMIGDTPDDILAGKNANVGCTIGVLTGFSTFEIFKYYKPDFIFQSVAEIPNKLDEILKIFK
ncbi:MAG: HAD family hydrolase [Candidatus Helarchaeota archaeon]